MTNLTKSTEIWESVDPVSFTIQESASEVDGKYILAKVIGPAFFPNTTSRNKVHYPSEAWENAISNDDFLAKLEDRLVFGTIGHESELDDNDIRDGKFSHIVTKVWIDESDGIGKAEYLILNTEPGKVLNTLLRIGSRLRVSTKAEGYFESSRNRDGSKSIVPDKFILERIDFVRDPGYVNALPSLVESLNPEISEEPDMSDQLAQVQESRINELKVTAEKHEKAASEAANQLAQVRENHARASAILEGYTGFGTPSAVQESFAELAQYRDIGTVQQIHEALDKGSEVLDNLSTSLEQTKEDLEAATSKSSQNSEYDDLGQPSEVRDALEAAQAALAELEQYRALGSLEELQSVIDRASEMTEALEEQELQNLANKYSVSIDIVKSLCDKCDTVEEAEGILTAIKGSAPPAAPVTEEDDNTPESDDELGDDQDDEKKPTVVGESMSSRLLQRSHKFASRIQEATANKSTNKPTSLAGRLMTTRR